ncbi:transmembrane protein 174 [Alligator mississippiensis]|uniref:transmembrane protein 174 n=1 Tax=Alligator mississippiensis TaxID=8496 RepID=UPI0003D10081|nr:transmembrane protein 174 [Alligator mississippiensis]
MEQNSNNVEDFSLNVFSVTPYQPSRSDALVSDDDKAGATVFFSGVFLGLVGITFTVMGWIRYEGITHLEWTQLLGPILLSVSVTFILIAVCKFKMLTCKLCKESDESASDMDQIPSRQSFVFTGINQPITFHGATVVQYIPPPYSAQEGTTMNPAHLHPVLGCRSVSSSGESTIPTSSPPQYYTVYPLENPAFTEDENYPAYLVGDTMDQRSDDYPDEPEELLEEICDNFSPPPYEEIYPLS